MGDSDIPLSVAICTRDRRADVLRALASLAEQRAAVEFEVLVVDNASRDDTGRACEAVAPELGAPLRVVREDTPGLAHARNRALREARGHAVVFMDDDATCRPGWVAAHARAFSARDVVATGGRILPVLPEDMPALLRSALETEIGGPAARYDFGDAQQDILTAGLPLPFGANFGVARAAVLAIGGFRADLGWGRDLVPGEETELLERLRRAGAGRFVYVPDAAVDHRLAPDRATLAYYRRWQRGYGRSRVRMDPPGGVVSAARVAARSALRCLRRGSGGLSGIRERERAAGTLLELWDVLRERPRRAAPTTI